LIPAALFPFEDSAPPTFTNPEIDCIIFLLLGSLKNAPGVAISLKPASKSVVYLIPYLLGFGLAIPP
jgi:hypothetical protein